MKKRVSWIGIAAWAVGSAACVSTTAPGPGAAPDIDVDTIIESEAGPMGLPGGALIQQPAVATNGPPVATPDLFSVDEDTVLSAVLTATDPDGDPLLFALVDAPMNGVVSIDQITGDFTYVPDADFNGTDSFTFEVTDGVSGSATATIDLDVLPINDAPVIGAVPVFETAEDLPFTETIPVSDVDGPSLSVRVDQAPMNGTVVFDPVVIGEFTYTPDPHFFGLDEFMVVASDSLLDSSPPTRVTVVVGSVNDPPTVTGPALVTTTRDTEVSGQILGLDVEGDALVFFITTAPTSGTLTLSVVTGAFTYTPGPGFVGTDRFSVAASDGVNQSVPFAIDIDVQP